MMIPGVDPDGREELQKRHRQIHESTAAAHDRAAVMHEKAAGFSEAHGKSDHAEMQRGRAAHERQLAAVSRRIGAESVLTGVSREPSTLEWASKLSSGSRGPTPDGFCAGEPKDLEFMSLSERERAVAQRERAVAERELAADDRARIEQERDAAVEWPPRTGSEIQDGLRLFMPYARANIGCAAWAVAWAHADVWCCPQGQVRLIYDHADTEVARRLSAYHVRSAHDRTPNGEGDFADVSLWVSYCARTMDCYVITANTLTRVLALPGHEYAKMIEPVGILSTPSATWWRDQN